MLHNLLLDTARLEADASVGEEVRVAHGKGEAQDATVRVYYVDECCIGGAKARLLRLECVERQGRIQTCNWNAKVVS